MGRRNGLSSGSITGEEGALPGRATALTRSKRRVGKFEQDKKSKPAPLRGQEAGQRFYYCRVREFDDGEGLDLDGRDTLAYASTTRTPHLRQRLYSGMPDGYSFVPLALSRPLDRPRAAFERQRPGETAPTARRNGDTKHQPEESIVRADPRFATTRPWAYFRPATPPPAAILDGKS